MEQVIVLNQVTLYATGAIGLQWMKLVVDAEQQKVLKREPHRSMVDVGGDVLEQMKQVSDHLAMTGFPPVTTAMTDRALAVASVGGADEVGMPRRFSCRENEKCLYLDQVTLCADGSIGVRWLMQVVNMLDRVLVSDSQNLVMDYDSSIDAYADYVGDHMREAGFPAPDAEMIAVIRAVDAVGRADPDIQVLRAAKIEAKAAVEQAEAEAAAAALLTAAQQPPTEGQN